MFRVGVCFLVYLLSLPSEQEGTHFLLLMSFVEDFFNRLNSYTAPCSTSAGTARNQTGQFTVMLNCWEVCTRVLSVTVSVNV